jgi:hypothetical protein
MDRKASIRSRPIHIGAIYLPIPIPHRPRPTLSNETRDCNPPKRRKRQRKWRRPDPPTRRDGEELLRRTRIGSVVTAKAPPKRERKWVPEKRKRDGTWGVACLGAPAEAASRGAWRGDDACGDEATQRNEEDDERMLGWALSENGCRPISSQDVRPTLLDHKRDCGRRAAHDIWALTGLLTCVIVSLFFLPHVL